MKQNYNSLVSALSSSLCTIFPVGKSFLVNDVASLCEDSVKTKTGNLQLVFLLVIALSFGQQSVAKNTSNATFNSQKIIVNQILISSVAEGRGGGGGHGNDDWVIRHPLDVMSLGVLSEYLNIKEYKNNNNILHFLSNSIFKL